MTSGTPSPATPDLHTSTELLKNVLKGTSNAHMPLQSVTKAKGSTDAFLSLLKQSPIDASTATAPIEDAGKTSPNERKLPLASDLRSRSSSFISSLAAYNVHEDDSDEPNEEGKTKAVKQHLICSFGPSSKDVVDRMSVGASAHFIYYSLKDGKVRRISKKSGARQILKSDSSVYVDFCLYASPSHDLLACLSRAGSIDVWRIATPDAAGDAAETQLLHAVVLDTPQPFCTRLLWHPKDPQVLIAVGARGNAFFLSLAQLAYDADARATLSVLPNGNLANAPGLYRLWNHGLLSDVVFSPTLAYVALVLEVAVVIVAYNKLDDAVVTLPIAHARSVFWVAPGDASNEQRLVVGCDGEIHISTFLPADPVASSRLAHTLPIGAVGNGVTQHHVFAFDAAHNVLFVGSADAQPVAVFKVQREDASWRFVPLESLPATLAVSCMRSVNIDADRTHLLVSHEEGVCYFELHMHAFIEAGLAAHKKPNVSFLGASEKAAIESPISLKAASPAASNASMTSTASMTSSVSKTISNIDASNSITHSASKSVSNTEVVLLLRNELDAFYKRIDAERKARDAADKAKHEQVLRLISDSLNRNLGAIVEASVRAQLEKCVSAAFDSRVVPQLEACVGKRIDACVAGVGAHVAQISANLNSEQSIAVLRESIDALAKKTLVPLGDVAKSFSLVQTHLKHIANVLDASLQAAAERDAQALNAGAASPRIDGGSETLLAGSQSAASMLLRPAAAAAASPLTLQQEVDRAIGESRIDDAFRRVLNSRNLGVLLYVCRKFEPEVFFAEPALNQLTSPTYLSLLQQLAVDLMADTELKLAWIEEALINMNLDDGKIREHAPDILRYITSQCMTYMKVAAPEVAAPFSKTFKRLLKTSTSLLKVLSK